MPVLLAGPEILEMAPLERIIFSVFEPHQLFAGRVQVEDSAISLRHQDHVFGYFRIYVGTFVRKSPALRYAVLPVLPSSGSK